jgi:hypothetical protein
MTPTYYHPAKQTYFTAGDAFTLDGTQYASDHWRDASLIESLGLVPVVDVGTPKDSKLWVNTEELVGAERRVISTPKDPAVIAADAVADVEAKKALIRSVREGYLNRLSGIAFAAQLSGDTATTAAYLLVRQGLLDLTQNLPADPELVDAEVVQRYDALVALCTPSLMTAFANVDA